MGISLYRVGLQGRRLVTQPGADFDERGYSRFKHGDGDLARAYGDELGGRFVHERPDLVHGREPLVLVSAPYKVVPTASYALARHLHRRVDRARRRSGRAPATLASLSMEFVGSRNYARLDTEARRAELERACIGADELDFVGRHVVLIDDARITGLAEAQVTALVEAVGALSVTPLYVVELEPGVGAAHPTLEDRMNQAYVDGLGALVELFRSPSFVLNIRTVKYVLGAPPDALGGFLEALGERRLRQLHDAVVTAGESVGEAFAEVIEQMGAALAGARA